METELAGAFAAVMSNGSGTLGRAQLERDSVRFSHLLRSHGLGDGDRVAVLMENNLTWFLALLGIRRANMMAVPINWHLKPGEMNYVLADSDARAILTTDTLVDLATEALGTLPGIGLRLTNGPARREFLSLSDELDKHSDIASAHELDGGVMLYSSGTSGRPKGIIRPRPEVPFPTPNAIEALLTRKYGLDRDTVYLCPAPLYHAAPIGWSVAVMLAGGTVVIMPSFQPEATLAAIEQFKVTCAQFVPTHLIRMLKLPAETRLGYDLSSLKVVVHAAAPCPPEVKRQVIDWLGPVVYEYYSGSEGCGFTAIDSADWLAHPGSVGRSERGPIHIVDPESGNELGLGEIGLITFELGEPFRYHKDPERTRASVTAQGWGTHGDLGRVDADGYLYLSDRLSNLIISGGVNIYPQEVENVLVGHSAVADVAVIGVPNEDFGEEVKAVVELTAEARADPPRAEALIAFCKAELADFKCPRSIDFVDALPRHPNGKLLKRNLMDQYRTGASVSA